MAEALSLTDESKAWLIPWLLLGVFVPAVVWFARDVRQPLVFFVSCTVPLLAAAAYASRRLGSAHLAAVFAGELHLHVEQRGSWYEVPYGSVIGVSSEDDWGTTTVHLAPGHPLGPSFRFLANGISEDAGAPAVGQQLLRERVEAARAEAARPPDPIDSGPAEDLDEQ